MTDLTEATAMPSVLSDRTLTLNLMLRGGSGITVRSCEIIGRGFRNRISFNEVSEMDDILVSKLSHAIRRSLASVPDDGAHVLSLPDFLVELPGLLLSGVHIMIMEARDGVRNAIFRFRDFLGASSEAFRQDLGFEDPPPAPSERLAVNVFADICLPMLNLCRDMEIVKSGGARDVPADLLARIREFEFHTELLKRFIYNAGAGYSEPTVAHITDDRYRKLR